MRPTQQLPIPPAVKKLLVPLWNGAHRVGWLAIDHVSATIRGDWQTCSVCGRFRPMLYRRRVIPDRLVELWGLTPRQARALARKESCDCAGCGAKLRARRMAEVILQAYPVGSPPAPARSLKDWVQSTQAQELRVAEINRIDGIHEVLRGLPAFQSSDYTPGAKPGEVVSGVQSEDLTKLTYADSGFDLVVTSETLEHVSDLQAALASLRRVLRPGGLHIFTIPVLPGVPTTFARTVVRPDGHLEHVAPRICHPGGDVGYPVFTEFGADLPVILQAAGFDVRIHFGPTSDDDLAQVHVCRRLDAEEGNTLTSMPLASEANSPG